MEAEPMALCLLQTNAVVAHAENELVLGSRDLEHDLGGASVLVRVEDRFAQNSIKLRGNFVFLDRDLGFQIEAAGRFPNFSFHQVLEHLSEFRSLDLKTE